MSQTLNLLKQRRSFLGIAVTWVLLWIIPWGKLPTIQHGNIPAFLTDMLRLGIALLMFTIPGALLYILLRQGGKKISNALGVLPIGFTLSVLIIAVVGLLGRIVGMSFTLVKSIFALIGLAELILLANSKLNFVLEKKKLWESFQISILRNPPLILALVLATLMTFHDYLFFIDDTTYSAYITNWQHASQLGFKNIVHEMDAIEQARFWLAMYPMGQALLADLSGLSGLLLLANYLELFLVPLAVIISYLFARALGLARKTSGFAVLIQISLYTWLVGDQWPVGTWFYQSMSEDKVSATFILAPVFFIFVLQYFQSPSKHNVVLIFLTGICLALTHPVSLFLSCAIAAGMGLFSRIFSKTSWRNLLLIFFIFMCLMMPYVAIRFAEQKMVAEIVYDAKAASVSYEIERYTNVLNDTFYGLNPEVLKFFDIRPDTPVYKSFQYFRLIPVVLVALAGILAVANLRKGALYWYVVVAALLVFFVTLPYTGWLIGYFISARLISRAAWFSPLGIGGVLILKYLVHWLKLEKQARLFNNLTFLLLMSCILFVSPMLIFNIFPRVPYYFLALEKNKQLTQIGAFIEQNTTHPTAVIALDYWDTQLLPGVSAHVTLISFREEKEYNPHNYFLSVDEVQERVYASNIIRALDQTVSLKERCRVIDKFHVRFVLAEQENAKIYKDLVSGCGKNFDTAFEIDDLILLEFSE